MITKQFVPKICKGKDYEGFVKIRVPDYDERQSFYLIPELDEDIDAAAKAKLEGATDKEASDEGAKKISTRKMMAIMSNVRKQLPDWLVEINITRKDDNYVFTSLDEVRYDSEVGSVIQDCVNELLGKYRWGNPNTQPS